MKVFVRSALVALIVSTMAGCASNDKYEVRKSLFESTEGLVKTHDEPMAASNKPSGPAYSRVQSLAEQFGLSREIPKVAATFSDSQMVSFTVDGMKINEFIHHVFGGVLGVNYVVNSEVAKKEDPITLNFQNKLSKKQAFLAANEVLTDKAIGVTYKEGTYYLFPLENSTATEIAIGVGRDVSDLPVVGNNILQVFPMNYGVNISTERTLRQLADISISIDLEQSAVFMQGPRSKVKKVMELARLLDLPSNKGKYIGLLRLTYISTEEFSEQVMQLLESEGIPAGVGTGRNKNLALVPINNMGMVAVFSSNQVFLERVRFWQEKLDKPAEGIERRYFWYEPRNARARDLGNSLKPLFGSNGAVEPAAAAGNSSRDTRSALVSKAQGAAAPTSFVVSNDELSMVVDERTNTLVFHTTGKHYQKILPLIERMDTLPRQVILEATIAEVTLTDGFKYGIEYAFKNGSFGYAAGFMGSAAGTGMGALWTGVTEGENAAINLVKTHNLINVLSNPSLLVRDGVSANITVGNEIPITTGVIRNPLQGSTAEQTLIERRQTGLTLNVTPTINSQGVIIMEIALRMANADGEVLLNREVSTEVVASSGQTVILAGLISGEGSGDGSQVPVLGDIPVLGNLFKSQNKSSSKTELVILVTPKIINDGNQWGEIKNKFRKGLENIKF
jgi:general secretion pathway protein D